MTLENFLNFTAVSLVSRYVRNFGCVECSAGLVYVVDSLSEFILSLLNYFFFCLWFLQVSPLLLFIHTVLFPLYNVEMAVDIFVQMVLLFVGFACTDTGEILSVRSVKYI